MSSLHFASVVAHLQLLASLPAGVWETEAMPMNGYASSNINEVIWQVIEDRDLPIILDLQK